MNTGHRHHHLSRVNHPTITGEHWIHCLGLMNRQLLNHDMKEGVSRIRVRMEEGDQEEEEEVEEEAADSNGGEGP